MLKKLLLISLVVIVILAALTFVINPLEKLRQSRDDTRLADLESLKKAIDLYVSNNAKDIAAKSNLLCSACNNPNLVYSYRKFEVSDTSQSVSDTSVKLVEKQSLYVNGTGWLPLDLALNAKIGQTQLQSLPLDPLEKGYNIRTKLPFFNKTEDFVYTFTAGSDNKYKLTAKMESKKGLEKAKNDGGSINERVEVGTDLTLKP